MLIPAIRSLAAAAVITAGSIARAINIEDYAHEDAFKQPVLSPDGRALAYSQTLKGDHIVFVQDLETGEKFGINLESSDKDISRDAAYFWSTGKRFVCKFGGNYYTVDRDGRNAKMTIPFGGLVHNFRDEKNGALLLTGFEISQATGMGRFASHVYLPRPFVHRVNTIEGSSIGTGLGDQGRSPLLRVVDNPGRVLGWVATSDGQVLAGREFQDDKFRVLYRPSAKRENWTALPGLDWVDASNSPVGFTEDGETLFVSRQGAAGTWALHPYDLRTRTLGEPAVASESYDVFHPFQNGDANGVPQNQLIYSPKEKRLLGVRYTVDMPRMIWLDEGLAQAQAALDQTLPGKINSIVSLSDDLQRMVLLSWSANDPGTYHLFDREKGTLEKLFSRRPWFEAANAAEVKRFKFKGRSGVELAGYATLPPGRKPAKLPTLIVVGGRNRTLWEYDRYNQLLAGRGYLVLNVNHRGRLGLGESFLQGGEQGALMAAVGDVADAVNWAVQVGLADPQRVAIGGYNGVSGLLALLCVQENPALFRCGFINEPLVDLTKYVDRSRLNPWFYNQAVKMYGDPESSDGLARLQRTSPALNGKPVSIPVLVQHKDDIFGSEWIYNLTRDWAQSAGANVTFSHDYDEKFGYQTLAKYWQEDLNFLQKHMPAD